MILVSPTERPRILGALKAITEDVEVDRNVDVMRSSTPERMGVDFAWRAQGRWWGIQRKELTDLFASLNDGRLRTEIAQMRASIVMPHLVVEGQIRATHDGIVMSDGWGQPVQMSTLRRRLLSIGFEGVAISYTHNIPDTAQLIFETYVWSQKASHSTARTLPKPQSDWGKATNRDYQLAFLQQLPTIGPKTAETMLNELGRFPFVLDVTDEQLLAVSGIGPKTVRLIRQAIEHKS